MANRQWVYSAGTNSIEWKCRAVVDQYDQNITNNTSQIKVTFQFTRARSSSYASNGPTTAYITINGTKYTISVPSYNYSYIGVDDWKTIATKTVTITHNADGSKSIGVSCSWSQSGVQPNSCSVSGSPTLTTIPRASGVTCNDGNIGSATTINISRASSSFTHTLTYNFSGLTGTIATKTTSTSVGWTIPTSFYAKIPNAKSGKVTITCQTYSGSTLIGTKTCTANCFVVNSSPSVSAIAKDINAVTLRVTEDDQKIVKGLSNARVTTSATALNNASISSIVVTCDGRSASGANATINSVTSNVFTIKVTDSRGFVTTITKTLTLINYVAPAITDLKIIRAETTSPLTKISVKGLYWNGSFGTMQNSRSLLYYWKLSGTSAWSSPISLAPTVLNGNTFSYEANLEQGFDPNNSYDFLVRIQDQLTEFDKTLIMGKAIPLLELFKEAMKLNGAFSSLYTYGISTARPDKQGHYAKLQASVTEGDVLVGHAPSPEVDVDRYLRLTASGRMEYQGINIATQWSNSNGTVIRFYDGTQICMKKHNQGLASFNAWGNIYESYRFNMGNWPAAFTEIPFITTQSVTGNLVLMMGSVQSASTTAIGTITVMRATNATNSSTTIHVIGIGRWK